MPPHSRSQRRRQNTQQQRPANQRATAAATTANDLVPAVDDQVAADTLIDTGEYTDIQFPRTPPAAPVMAAPVVAPVITARPTAPALVSTPATPLRASTPATPLRASAPAASARTAAARRNRPRTTLEPVDYTKDYAAARRDLRWIVLWAGLLFVVMIVLKVSGIV